MNKYQIGRLGENLAEKYFKNKGFLTILRNFKVRGGEIDLICQKGQRYTFIEVKTRTSNTFGFPEEAMTYAKRQRMKTAIFRFLAEHKPLKWQADLVSIELDKETKTAKIRHFENVEL